MTDMHTTDEDARNNHAQADPGKDAYRPDEDTHNNHAESGAGSDPRTTDEDTPTNHANPHPLQDAQNVHQTDTYLGETRLLDFTSPVIDELVRSRGWEALEEGEKILRIYDFVRDEIPFGYNRTDAIPASEVLRDGYGQCNTKGILLMALLRRAGVPCRFHGFTIHKSLQKGAITGIWYRMSPSSIVHSWVEVYHRGTWYNLEGFIVDQAYLRKVQQRNPGVSQFCGYGIATADLSNPPVFWQTCNTYIQKEGITGDLGIFPDPDTFFISHTQGLGPLKRLLFRRLVRHIMNRNVQRVRREW